MRNEYNKTMRCCFLGSASQAIAVSFLPLLFGVFQDSYGISLPKVTLLITLTFLIQLAIAAMSVRIIARIGYRANIVIADALIGMGFVGLTFLPDMISDPYAGIVIAVALLALGSGMLEVSISPVIESCPSDNKERSMSFLHSFYCWGMMTAVLLSTLFFELFGLHNWRMVCILWAAVPLLDGIAFLSVPIAPLVKEGEKGMSVLELMKNRVFWLMLVAIICAGASEQSVSQWASLLAEKGLGVSKTLGDLMGPMAFALMMGLSRLIFSKMGKSISLWGFMMVSCGLCLISYLIISLSPWPLLSLLGCGLCGFATGIFWPGSLSMASGMLKRGGTALFSLLALGGSLGCSAGPTLTGLVSDAASGDLKVGVLVAIIFPVALTLCLLIQRRMARKA